VLEARLADDCHSYNVVLQRGVASNTVVLYVARTIRSGEELQLWFSEQILVALAVPFLTPLNIQGKTEHNFSLSHCAYTRSKQLEAGAQCKCNTNIYAPININSIFTNKINFLFSFKIEQEAD
jgi:hypothetical protein